MWLANSASGNSYIPPVCKETACLMSFTLINAAQVMSEMLATHVLSHYDKFLEGVTTVSTFERELQVRVPQNMEAVSSHHRCQDNKWLACC